MIGPKRATVITSVVSAVLIVVFLVLADVAWSGEDQHVASSAPSERHKNSMEPVPQGQKIAIYFDDALPESHALSMLHEVGFDAPVSAYDTIRVDVKLMVPPTQQQLSRLRVADGVWSLAYDGEKLRDADSPMPPKRKRMLQRQWAKGGICTLNRLQLGIASHFTEAQIQSLVNRLFAARIRSLQKPSNVIHVHIQTDEEFKRVKSVSAHEDVKMITYVHEG